MKLTKIYLDSYGYDLDSEIVVEKNIIEKIDEFYNWNDTEKVIRHIESDIVDILTEKEDDGVDGVYEKELVFAKEDHNDTESYDVITFNAKFNVEGNHVKIEVESK